MERKEKGSPGGRRSVPRRGGASHLTSEGDVGSALRSVFEETVNEDIPLEMLDLLNKLG